jgi:hypothetical protein
MKRKRNTEINSVTIVPFSTHRCNETKTNLSHVGICREQTLFSSRDILSFEFQKQFQVLCFDADIWHQYRELCIVNFYRKVGHGDTGSCRKISLVLTIINTETRRSLQTLYRWPWIWTSFTLQLERAHLSKWYETYSDLTPYTGPNDDTCINILLYFLHLQFINC